MKRTFLLLAITSMAVLGMQSCNKEEIHAPAITQTINVALKVNETYTFVLTENTRDDEYRFTTQAQHYSISTLGVDANGRRVYQYTPALNYAGNDQVVVSNDWERNEEQGNHSAPPQSGNCNGGSTSSNENGGEEDHYIVTINFVVDKDQSRSKN